MNPTSEESFIEPASAPRRSIWWWIACVSILLSLSVLLWWGTSFVYHLLTFHPTGQIVYECWPERRTARRCIVNADGSKKRVITPTPIPMPDGVSGGSPTWSPDEKKLAFFKLDKTSRDPTGLYVVDQDGHNEILLTTSLASSPDWSPDSKKIAYTVYLGQMIQNPRIYTVNPDGSNQVQLTNFNSSSPAWSPDGKKIAYQCKGELCIMNADGSGQIELTHDFLDANYQPDSPSWSPDGQYIVYHQQNPFCFLCPMTGELWIMKADGSQQTKLTDGPVDKNPVWQPGP